MHALLKFALIALVGIWLQCGVARAIPLEDTLAWRMLVLEEKEGTPVSKEKKELLRQVLVAMFTASGAAGEHPKTAEQAIRLTELLSMEMAKLNMMQPARKSDWTSTLGEAFQPRVLSQADFDLHVGMGGNAARKVHYVSGRPVYFVDCDMASLLLISAFQMRDWDVALVEVPDHNFIRWALPAGQSVNWDWTNAGSFPDRRYLSLGGSHAHDLMANPFLKSFSPKDAEAYYVGMIAYRSKSPEVKNRLFRQAVSVPIVSPTTYNNAAWFYATSKDAEFQFPEAAFFAYRAVAASPGSANAVDTLACVFNRGGDRAYAIKLETWAIENANASEAVSFRANLKRMEAGELCA